MTEHLAWWTAGTLVGGAAGVVVLRRRGHLTRGCLAIYPMAALGCLYGAKVQYRLRFLPALDALLVPPRELMEPGLHIPLGLAGAIIGAALACAVVRAPWRSVGDALAMAYVLMMPIGRIGCLRAGCCNGTTCPTWLRWMCMADGRTPDAVVPTPFEVLLPVHPVPLYFASLGLAVAAILVWLLRRGAPPGTLMAVTLVLYPLGQLAIETVREAPPDLAQVMTPTLDALIASGIVLGGALGVAAWIRRRSGIRQANVQRAAE